MNITGQDYSIWKNDKFIVECSIDTTLWSKKIIDEFQQNLIQILEEVFKKSDVYSTKYTKLISLFFSGDRKIIELNYKFRKLNSVTNILTFPSLTNSKNTFFLGDIIFSNETICKEAKRNNKSVNNHLTHLFVHGILHLLGYDHQTEEEAKKMENLEIEILGKLGIASPY